MDVAQFRLDFPEFTSTVNYPNTQIEFWATLAEAQINETAWTTMKPFAVKLYVAHEITLARQNSQAATTGGTPGQTGGVASSKTVGSVSVGYDTTVIAEKDAGWWNLTNYGKQFIRLARLYGAGCINL